MKSIFRRNWKAYERRGDSVMQKESIDNPRRQLLPRGGFAEVHGPVVFIIAW